MKLRVVNLGKTFRPQSGVVRSISAYILARIKGRKLALNTIFDQLNMEVHNGECVAILGNNGSGKSTLLRCIAGVTVPSRGKIEKHGRVAALLTHGLGNYEDLPVKSNILLVQQLLGLSRKEAKKNILSIAKMAGLEERTLSATSQLSEGMRAKLALCCLPFVPFDLLLLDESLNHVDEEFRSFFLTLTRKWISEGRSVLLTSHEHSLIERFATRKLLLKDKALIALS